ncbi:MAG: Rpn family recombination-promoting nuclease/putative transposase [Inconstantimicrobium porci]|uniref:Rpn family recombination-promoting nuclease/putative transposase n=1 Tax=Inconstantimicrobium porci TaxID=2652291 RepID=A0A7X2MZF9_9CLOT|nr:Rpn family recombination-promoting nuclease/putative transposase [Inconstantimicrobium porci]MDY5910631.1 Rpn family recombination-promoting nuclease/putative transposase [Inconstantimicrobium porci]MSR91868.1 Rpn family recombination-promoting nuclease/putative transposase [Inconstantimicrobium porci]
MIRGLLDPKIDFIFKNIFGAEKNKRILISFLNSVLKNPHPITAVEIKNTDVEKAFIEDKFSRLDIKAETSNNEIINIEIQMKNELNDKCDEKDLLVAWTEFLKDPESERVRNLEMSIEEIREAKDELIKISADKKQRELYEMRAKILKDKVSALNEAERKGIQKGIEEGRKEGIKEAIENSRLKDIETVLKLLDKKFGNISIEMNNKIQNLNSEKLKLIIENILDIDTLEQLKQYL